MIQENMESRTWIDDEIVLTLGEKGGKKKGGHLSSKVWCLEVS